MVVCLERGADLHMAQLMPLPLSVSCFSKIQIGFTRDAEPLKLHSGSGSGFFTGSGSRLPVPAQRSKRKQIQLAYDCRLDVSQGGRTLCTNWLHTGADLIQGIVSYVRIKTRTLKNSSARH